MPGLCVSRSVRNRRRRSGRFGYWLLALTCGMFVQCERYYYDEFDYDVVEFTSTRSGDVSETLWTITGEAHDWEVVNRFDVYVSLDGLDGPGDESGGDADTSPLADTDEETGAGTPPNETAEIREPAAVRVTLALEDGTVETFDYSEEDPKANYLGLLLPRCSAPSSACTQTVRLRLESLTSTPFTVTAYIEGSISVYPNCLNTPREEDVEGLSISLQPVLTE